MQGFVHAIALEDYRLTGDRTLATHGFNAREWTLYIVPVEQMDNTAEIVSLPDGTFLVNVT